MISKKNKKTIDDVCSAIYCARWGWITTDELADDDEFYASLDAEPHEMTDDEITDQILTDLQLWEPSD